MINVLMTISAMASAMSVSAGGGEDARVLEQYKARWRRSRDQPDRELEGEIEERIVVVYMAARPAASPKETGDAMQFEYKVVTKGTYSHEKVGTRTHR